MIQLCVREDFPVSRTGLGRLKGPTAQTESFLYLSAGLSVCLKSQFYELKSNWLLLLTFNTKKSIFKGEIGLLQLSFHPL